MNANDIPARLLRARMAEHEGAADAAAIAELNRLIREINERAAIAFTIATASPAIAINPLWFESVRAAVAMAFAEADRAANSLPITTSYARAA